MLAAGMGWKDEVSQGTEAEAIEAIKLCQELGFQINAQNDAGETALHSAAALRRANQVVQFLFDSGAKLDIKDKRGRTPLDAVAASTGGQGVEGIRARESTVALLRRLMGLPIIASASQ
jgi:ankyrin repeat protein